MFGQFRELLISYPALTVIWFFSLWLLLWLPVAVPLALRLNWRPFQPSLAAQKLPLLAWLYLLAPLALWQVGGLDRYSDATLDGSLVRPAVLLLAGLLCGSLSLMALSGIQLWAGWLQVNGSFSLKPTDVLFGLGLGLWVGWTEELIFRGFIQDQLQQDLSVWTAAALASLIFAVLHGVWEGRDLLPQLPGLWLMGMVLVLARQTASGNLALAWGLHSGWIWAISSLGSAQLGSSGRLPVWITGFNDSPLAGLIGLLFLLTTAGGLWWVGQA